VAIPVLIYLLAINEFTFYPYAILGAADIMIVSYFAFLAVRALGYATAPAIWCGIGNKTQILVVTVRSSSILYIYGMY
jgi:hypothetical protein